MTNENIALQAWRKDISYVLHAVQGESDSRTFNFILYDQTGAVISLTGKTVAFYVQKPDGNIVMLATTTSGSTISVTLTLQACAVPGVMPCWIQLVDENGDDLRVDSLLLEVQACNFDGAVESSSEFTALQQALGDVAKFNSHLTNYDNPHQVNGNQIRTGKISGNVSGGPYFDLDANDGSGEIRISTLRGVEDKALMLLKAYSQNPEEGFIQLQRIDASGSYSPVITCYEQASYLQYGSNSVHVNNEKVEFSVGGYARASIENDGAYFGNIYQNGNKIVSYDTLPMDNLPQARINLGMGKLLWSGSWSSGNISVPAILNYSVLQIIFTRSSVTYTMVASIKGIRLRGICGDVNLDGGQTSIAIACTISGTTLTNLTFSGFFLFPAGKISQMSGDFTITEIYGIC